MVLVVFLFICSLLGCNTTSNTNASSSDTTNATDTAEQIGKVFELNENSTINTSIDPNNITMADIYTPDGVIYNFIEGMRTNNFNLMLLQIYDGITTKIDISNQMEIQYGSLGVIRSMILFRFSSDVNELVFSILTDDKINEYIGKSLNDGDYEYITNTLNPLRLKDVRIVDIFKPDDKYIDEAKEKIRDVVSSYVKDTSIVYEYRVAICEFEGKYFSIGFRINYIDRLSFITTFWDGYGINVREYKPHYMTNNIEDFNSYFGTVINTDEYFSLNETQNIFINSSGWQNYIDGQKRFFWEDDSSFRTPEAAVEKYINSLKNCDLKSILNLSTAFLKVENFDFNNYNRLYKSYLSSAFLGNYDFTKRIEESFYAFNYASNSSIEVMALLGDVPSYLKDLEIDGIKTPYYKENDNYEDRKELPDSTRLKDLELVEIFTPQANSVDYEEKRKKLLEEAKLNYALDKCELVAIVKFEGLYRACPFTLLKYGDEWRIDDFLPSGMITARVDDISLFDSFK